MDNTDQIVMSLAECSLRASAINNTSRSAYTPAHTASFLGIPAELRNHIYDLAFTPTLVHHTIWSGEKINLAESHPPNKSLLLVCQQIYDEAKKVYQKYRNYWSSHTFCLRNRAEDLETVLSFDDKALDSIIDLEIVEWYICDEEMELTMISGRRGWYWYVPCHGGCECAFHYIGQSSKGGYMVKEISRHLYKACSIEEEKELQENGLKEQKELPLRVHLEALEERFELFCDETLMPERDENEGEDVEEERQPASAVDVPGRF